MSPTRRAALTLVETLVVIVIIGMLVALLMPSLGPRAASSHAQCINNQRNLALAILAYTERARSFPGYRQSVKTNGGEKTISWQLAIAPQLERLDIYQALIDGTMPFLPYMEISVCAGDAQPDKKHPWTSYVVNTGQFDTPAAPDPPAHGIFHDHVLGSTRVNLEHIRDGANNTLLLSENLDAHHYNDWPLVSVANVQDARNSSERATGFVYWPSATLGADCDATRAINGRAGQWEPADIPWERNSPCAARPSSRHPGGVIVAFAGGKIIFLRDDIDYQVYALLMTPAGANATPPQTRILVEDDYQ